MTIELRFRVGGHNIESFASSHTRNQLTPNNYLYAFDRSSHVLRTLDGTSGHSLMTYRAFDLKGWQCLLDTTLNPKPTLKLRTRNGDSRKSLSNYIQCPQRGLKSCTINVKS